MAHAPPSSCGEASGVQIGLDMSPPTWGSLTSLIQKVDDNDDHCLLMMENDSSQIFKQSITCELQMT